MSDEFEAQTTDPVENPASVEISEDVNEVNPTTDAASPEAPSTAGGHRELSGPSLASVIDVPLQVNVEIGSAKMLVREVLQLNKGSVVPLDRMSGDPADILVNGRLIARGEVTVLEDSLAVRIVELVGSEQSGGAR